MPLLVNYTLKNIIARKLTSGLTILGLALVVFVFAAVLMLSNGMDATMVGTGNKDNVIIIRQGSQTETMSIIYRRDADIVKTDPAIAIVNDTPLYTNEIVVLIIQNKRSNNEPSNIPLRGITLTSLKLRPDLKIIEGRMYTEGVSEIIAGKKVAANFQDCGLGESVRFGNRDWKVVGIFDDNGSGYESEIWGDVTQLSDAFQRPIFSSLTMRLKSPEEFTVFKKRIEDDPRLPFEVNNEIDYYSKQTAMTSTFINVIGIVVSVFFSLGAIVGAMITMYASVANRTKEIGTLRALGFRRRNILFTFLVEAILISLVSGVIGILCASFLRLVEVSTTNWDTFSELAFSFEVSTDIVIGALIFAVSMGIIGGFLPAVSASRLKIINALRAK